MQETLDATLGAKLRPTTVSEDKGFFSFRTMVSVGLIRILYLLGMIGLTLFGILIIVVPTQQPYVEKIVLGLLLLVPGNVLWRVFCEVWILLFSMHDILGSIERELKKA